MNRHLLAVGIGGSLLAALTAMPLLAVASLAGSTTPAAHPDVPPVAMTAYLAGEALVAEDGTACRVPWSLLAAVGSVESDHGRHGGSQLGADGVARPPIIGIPLDGRPGVLAVPDTDDGALDRDLVWDRAVGPMQFIPASWARWGIDGDGDGRAEPQDIGDAAPAAARHLCGVHPGDLTRPAAARLALRGYNDSDDYIVEVLRRAARYAHEATPATDRPGLLAGTGPVACPVGGPVSFIDSWGFPRSGGRTHQGQDLFAVRGTPIVAVQDGTVVEARTGAGLGGTVIWQVTEAGDAWYYAHLDTIRTGVGPGVPVRRGEVIGTVGDTGNARGTSPHLHIQWRPSGRRGPDVNPYPLLDPACPGH